MTGSLSAVTPSVHVTVSGHRFNLSRHATGWAWTHLSESGIGIKAESQVIFPEAGEALDDLLDYVAGLSLITD